MFGVALAVRLAIAFLFFGSVDVTNNITDAGLMFHGRRPTEVPIPHFPGVHLMIWAAGVLAYHTELPASFLFKFSGCLYDSVIAALLFKGGSARAGWLYALAPVPILVFAIHGQWDSICLALLLGSVLVLRREGRVAGVLAGVLFVLAAIAKPIALPFAPLLFERKRFVATIAGMAACFLIWLGVLWAIGSPLTVGIVEHVFRYARTGITYFGLPVGLGLKPNRLLLLAPMLVLLPLYWTRRIRREDAILLFYAFTVATCGLSAQYLSWLVPFLLLRGHDRFAALYSLAAGVFLITFYVSPFGGYRGYNFENLAAFAPLKGAAWLAPRIADAADRLAIIRTVGDYVIPLVALAFLATWIVRRRKAVLLEEAVPVTRGAIAPVWVALGVTAVMFAVALMFPRPDARAYQQRMNAKFGAYLLTVYRPPVEGLATALVVPMDVPPAPVKATALAYAWLGIWCAVAGLWPRSGTFPRT